MLRCAAFREEVRTEIRSESGTVLRQETAGRDGVLFVRAERTDTGTVLTAWYDSLAVWRQGPEGKITPETEGLLGGRWIGVLSPEGRYAGAHLPFVPDEVAEIADLRGVVGDFFPSVAPALLKRKDARYQWKLESRSDTAGAVNDTLEVPMRRETEEEGWLAWDARLGPVQWERTITIAAGIQAKGPIKRGIRSVVTQRIRVIRLPNPVCD